MKTTIAMMLASLLTLGAAIANAAPAQPAKAPTQTQHGVAGQDGQIKVATCNDGKEYWSRTNEHRGACSGHGGVASWADGSPVKSNGRKTSYR